MQKYVWARFASINNYLVNFIYQSIERWYFYLMLYITSFLKINILSTLFNDYEIPIMVKYWSRTLPHNFVYALRTNNNSWFSFLIQPSIKKFLLIDCFVSNLIEINHQKTFSVRNVRFKIYKSVISWCSHWAKYINIFLFVKRNQVYQVSVFLIKYFTSI